MLTGRAGRRGGGGGAGPQPGEGGHGPGDGLARRRGLMRCGGRVCWANAELCAQSDGCSRKAVQGSRGCGACWAGERLRRAVRGLVGRELRCDVRCGLSRASAGCRGGGLRASCAWGCGIVLHTMYTSRFYSRVNVTAAFLPAALTQGSGGMQPLLSLHLS